MMTDKTMTMTMPTKENADLCRNQYDKLARDLLLYYTDTKKGENLIISQMSIMLLLSMLTYSTAGETKSEIEDYLCGDMDGEAFAQWLLATGKAVTDPAFLHSANAVCLRKSFRDAIRDGFGEKLKERFDAELFCSEHMMSDVNHWVKKHTNGMIEEIADKSMDDALLTFMNAIAFDAAWEETYWPSQIKEGRFRSTGNRTEPVTLLKSTEDEYVEDAFFTGMVKPYKGGKYALMALLPKKFGRQYLHKALEQMNLSGLYLSRTRGYIVNVTMPEFTADFDEKMNDYCENKGLQTVFTDHADFSPMSTSALNVGEISHKAKIEVSRHGTKAAAVTFSGFVGCTPGVLEHKNVKLTRPFVYAIVHTETGLPVFAGIENKIAKIVE